MRHLEVYCKNEKHFSALSFVLKRERIDHYRIGEGQDAPIIICGEVKKKDIRSLAEHYKIKITEIVKKEPDWDAAMKDVEAIKAKKSAASVDDLIRE